MDPISNLNTRAQNIDSLAKIYLVPLGLLALILVLFSYIWFRQQRPKNFPPGPPNLPVIGSLLSLMSSSLEMDIETYSEMVAHYGNVFSAYLGPRPCVFVNGHEHVKRLLAREDCSARPDAVIIRARSFNKLLGLVVSNGHLWREQRRFTVRHLRDFGFGKRSIQVLIQEEVETLLTNLEEEMKNTPDLEVTGMNHLELFPTSVINILWAIMAGVRHNHKNKDFKQLTSLVQEFFRNTEVSGSPVEICAFLQYIPIINSSFNAQLKCTRELQEYMKKTIHKHVMTYQEDNMRDFIDVYLREMKTQENDPNTTFTEEQLICVLLDLFMAGTETTSASISYIVLYLIIHPEVQTKMRLEIEQIVGRHRLPELEDANKLHYTQAVIHEVLRSACIVPFTLRATDVDVEIMGYTVPKDTTLVVDLWGLHYDEKHWGDPEVFRPERFLNEKGSFVFDDYLLPFGHGPRVCLGKSLAKDTTFLFIASIFQRFAFSIPSGCSEPSMEPMQGLTTFPRPYRVAVQALS